MSDEEYPFDTLSNDCVGDLHLDGTWSLNNCDCFDCETLLEGDWRAGP